MDIKIYQINTDRDANGVAFVGYVALPRFQDALDINSSIYDKVYDAPAEAMPLEDISFCVGYCRNSGGFRH